MRSRLSLYLNSLSLEEILYLEEEIDRRKDKYRQHYAVLSVQSDRRIVTSSHPSDLAKLARDMRKYIVDCAAQGGGIQLAYSPEVSVLMFTSVEGASRTCTALLNGLSELNGKSTSGSYKLGLKLGLSCGEDTLAPGSPRCVRTSGLVKRANQAAWRAATGTVMMDECSYDEWPDRHAATRMPIDIDGLAIYRAVPGAGSGTQYYDNEKLNQFLAEIVAAGISTLKYTLERDEGGARETAGAWSTPVAIADLHLEGYNAQTNKNMSYTERLSASGYAERLEAIRRVVGDMGLALVRLEAAH